MRNNILLTHRLIESPNASSKARRDVELIAEREGWKVLVLNTGKRHLFFTLYSLLSLFVKIPMKSNVVIQYPLGRLYTNLLIEFICKFKFVNIVLLVHDLESYRFRGVLSLLEKVCISLSSSIIVHNDRMKLFLLNFFPQKKYYVLNLFDYLISDNSIKEKLDKSEKYDIVFAGNLEKSLFIKNLKSGFGKCKFHMYGLPPIKTGECVVYQGVFSPDSPEILYGIWGVVWDGPDIETCSDYLGQYLRIISPHKISLYITMGIMPIVWRESAMATFVENENIGISVSSLKEIPCVLEFLTDADVQLKQKNLKIFSEKLQSGFMLSSVFHKLNF